MASVHESVLSRDGRRYLWVAVAVVVLAIGVYAWRAPAGLPGGGTWLGYALGTLAALLILWLTALGVRKRSYASKLGTVRGWVSAHVYLGLAVVPLATLHAGFRFGWNVHTLAYALTCVVVALGVVGVVLYARYPERMSANRQGRTREQLIEEISDLDARAVRVARGLPAEYDEAMRSGRDRLMLGGSALSLLFGRDGSSVVLPRAGGSSGPVPNPYQATLLAWLGDRLARSEDGELSVRVQELLTLTSAKRGALERMKLDLRLQAWLDVWLYLHVPLSFGLLAALLAHVASVFIYW
ncbi:MAG: hypothetical protein WCH32_11725 [Pseudomonadota bacterium]